MKTIIAIAILCLSSAAAFGAAGDTTFTVTATLAQTNAVIRVVNRANAKEVAAFVLANPGVVLSTNGVTVSGAVGGSPVGNVTLKTIVGYAREVCGQALDGVVQQEASVIAQENATTLQQLGTAYKAASQSVKDQVKSLLGVP